MFSSKVWASFIEKVRNEDSLRVEKLTFVRTFCSFLWTCHLEQCLINSRSSIQMCGWNGDAGSIWWILSCSQIDMKILDLISNPPVSKLMGKNTKTHWSNNFSLSEVYLVVQSGIFQSGKVSRVISWLLSSAGPEELTWFQVLLPETKVDLFQGQIQFCNSECRNWWKASKLQFSTFKNFVIWPACVSLYPLSQICFLGP